MSTETSTATITPGSTVKVEYEAEYKHTGLTGRHIMQAPDGAEVYAPAEAKVQVVGLPFPTEPGVGSVVTDDCCYKLFKRFATGWRRMLDDSMTRTGSWAMTWREVVAECGGPGNTERMVLDSSRYAQNMRVKPLRIPFVASNGLADGMAINFSVNEGNRLVVHEYGAVLSSSCSKWNARDLAWAILRATGGM